MPRGKVKQPRLPGVEVPESIEELDGLGERYLEAKDAFTAASDNLQDAIEAMLEGMKRHNQDKYRVESVWILRSRVEKDVLKTKKAVEEE